MSIMRNMVWDNRTGLGKNKAALAIKSAKSNMWRTSSPPAPNPTQSCAIEPEYIPDSSVAIDIPRRAAARVHHNLSQCPEVGRTPWGHPIGNFWIVIKAIGGSSPCGRRILTGGQKMNIKSLLLGSAAALVAVSGARAADAVVIAE